MDNINEKRTINKELQHIIEHLKAGNTVMALSLLIKVYEKEKWQVRKTDKVRR